MFIDSPSKGMVQMASIDDMFTIIVLTFLLNHKPVV